MTVSTLDELDDDVSDDEPATVVLVPRSLASDVEAYVRKLESEQRRAAGECDRI